MMDNKPGRVLTDAAFAHADGRLSDVAADIARGTMRMLTALHFAPVLELTLASGRRADIAALGPKGEIWIVEVKSCLADFRTDEKWQDYLAYCDRYFFAVDCDFPSDVIPKGAGLILADRYGAEIVRNSLDDRLSAGRRKELTLRFARAASQRLHGIIDPGGAVSVRSG